MRVSSASAGASSRPGVSSRTNSRSAIRAGASRTSRVVPAVAAIEAGNLGIRGDDEHVVAVDPWRLDAADALLPLARAGAQIERRHATGVRDREHGALVDHRRGADVSEVADLAGAARKRQEL